MMVAQVTDLTPYMFVHHFSNPHIYENQFNFASVMVHRSKKKLPTLLIDPDVKNIFDFRAHHFEIRDYDPHPAIKPPTVAV